MGVTFTGDWEKLSRTMNNVVRNFRTDMGKNIGKNLMKIERKVLIKM